LFTKSVAHTLAVNSDTSLNFGLQMSAVIKREYGDSAATMMNIDIYRPGWSYLDKIWYADVIDGHSHKARSNCSGNVTELM